MSVNIADIPDRVEIGVLMQRSYQSEDHFPVVFVSHEGMFASPPVVAAQIL